LGITLSLSAGRDTMAAGWANSWTRDRLDATTSPPTDISQYLLFLHISGIAWTTNAAFATHASAFTGGGDWFLQYERRRKRAGVLTGERRRRYRLL